MPIEVPEYLLQQANEAKRLLEKHDDLPNRRSLEILVMDVTMLGEISPDLVGDNKQKIIDAVINALNHRAYRLLKDAKRYLSAKN